MKKCEWCSKDIDREEEGDEFTCECSYLSYGNFRKCLCAECALQAIEDEVDGVYFETCEECGITFDLVDVKSEFASQFTWYSGTSLEDHWAEKILRGACAIGLVVAESHL